MTHSEAAEQLLVVPEQTGQYSAAAVGAVAAPRHLEVVPVAQDGQVGQRTKRVAGLEYSEDPVAQYLRAIGKVPLLTKEDEQVLGNQVLVGQSAQEMLHGSEPGSLSARQRLELLGVIKEGMEASDRFVRANLRLVVSIAKKYPHTATGEMLDHIQAGNLGLHRASIKFDSSKGFKFSTYATYWIKQSIARGIASTGRAVKMDPDVEHQGRKLAKLEGDNYPDDEIMYLMSLDPAKLERLRHYNRLCNPLSLFWSVGEKEDGKLVDILPDHIHRDPGAEAVDTVMTEGIYDILQEKLSPHEMQLVAMRLGLFGHQKHTFTALAPKLGYGENAEMARRHYNKVTKTLKDDDDVHGFFWG